MWNLFYLTNIAPKFFSLDFSSFSRNNVCKTVSFPSGIFWSLSLNDKQKNNNNNNRAPNKIHRTKQKCVALELSANIVSIVLKYLICLPGGWEASLSLDKPVSHQHILKNQNVFWNFDGSWYTVIVLSAFEVRSSQAGKSKSSSCPRKKPSRELWPICQELLASKFGMRELALDL